MDEKSFQERMREADDKLATQHVPALWRPFAAWFLITGETQFIPLPPDPLHSPFDGPNLYHQIETWYGKHYPQHATIQSDWGTRWFIIRGECFRARIPIVFNLSTALNAFEHLEGLSQSFYDLLTDDERTNIGYAFNGFFRQASDINLCLTVWQEHARNTINDFLERGWADLRDAGAAFQPNDPASILFTIQQASEKYLKALLLESGKVSGEAELKKLFGHDVLKLFNACTKTTSPLVRLQKHIGLLDYDASVRYQQTKLDARDVIARLNLSYAICHTAAKSMLSRRKERPVAT